MFLFDDDTPDLALAVTAIGMATSLGPDWPSSCAAARAGILRARELSVTTYDRAEDAELPVIGHTVSTLTEGFSERGLWSRLVSLALRDILSSGRLEPEALAGTACVFSVGGSFHYERARQLREEEEQGSGGPAFEVVEPWLSQGLESRALLDLPAPLGRGAEVLFGDEAGIGAALARAQRLLDEKRAERVLIASVDATTDAANIERYERLGILKCGHRPTGQMPGEASVLLLVEPDTGGPSVARINGLAQGLDSLGRFDEAPPTGEGYVRCLLQSVARSGGRTGEFYVDLNGDYRRAMEWGTAVVQLPPELRGIGSTYPVTHFGAIRGCFGAASIALAAHMWARGAPAPSVVSVLAGSDDGRRACFAVQPGTGYSTDTNQEPIHG